MQYSLYYQANVTKTDAVFLVGVLKSLDHACFDRTIDRETSLFEFFVPEAYEPLFLEVMHYFEEQAIVQNLKKLPNRLMHSQV